MEFCLKPVITYHNLSIINIITSYFSFTNLLHFVLPNYLKNELLQENGNGENGHEEVSEKSINNVQVLNITFFMGSYLVLLILNLRNQLRKKGRALNFSPD